MWIKSIDGGLSLRKQFGLIIGQSFGMDARKKKLTMVY